MVLAMVMPPPRLDLARYRAPVWAGVPARAGRKVRLRVITPADQRRLAGFDREAADTRRVGEYRHWAAHRAEADFHFAIETLRGGLVVGSLSATEADSPDRFSYGIGIGPQHRRCGYAGDAVITLLRFMFGERGYRKCEVSIYGGNVASLSMHAGLGFREEGRVRDTELSRDGVKYLVLMGITDTEFAEIHPDFPAASSRGRHWRSRGRHRDR
ncbi:GNAT family N-acetyltransferase [Amycolatopsis tucumanensis]|uniref:GNAT family N-acetyltransferase n=1 Tax=Amycolatopsis tucumanensis TaxID=401106 RepID=A0ABP7HYP0_9PSEU|nr:GNAT family protein [Amycolatopsis tucumanensis]MCF6428646.1 GNAT family N-acetyltransferase [Amycolatopsis tucumanensis]